MNKILLWILLIIAGKEERGMLAMLWANQIILGKKNLRTGSREAEGAGSGNPD